jgi:hypothetical protein
MRYEVTVRRKEMNNMYTLEGDTWLLKEILEFIQNKKQKSIEIVKLE